MIQLLKLFFLLAGLRWKICWNLITSLEQIFLQSDPHHCLSLQMKQDDVTSERDNQQMVSPLLKNLPFGLHTALLCLTNRVPQDPVGCSDPPPAPASGPAFWNNEGNNNELKSPPPRKARGQTTYREFTPNTFSELLHHHTGCILLLTLQFTDKNHLMDHFKVTKDHIITSFYMSHSNYLDQVISSLPERNTTKTIFMNGESFDFEQVECW